MKKIYWVILLFFIHYVHTKSLRILMMTDKFPHAARAYINNQISGLLDAGHEVFILSTKKEQVGECQIFTKYNLKERTFYEHLPEDLRNFDVVYAQFGLEGLLGMELLKSGYMTGKLIVSFRGDDASSYLYYNPHAYDELFQFAHLCLPVCDKFRKILIAHGCEAQKTRVLYSSVDCEQFPYFDRSKSAKNRRINILTVARLYKRKGVEYCIRAIAKLKKYYKEIFLTIIGDGPEYKRLKKLITALGLEKQVELVGYKSHEEILESLWNSDIFVCPAVTTDTTKQDGISNVLKEAMATGLAPITTNHGGNNEIIVEGENGLLIPERNVKILVEKILYLIKYPQNRLNMGKFASMYIRRIFCKERLNLELIRILEEITS